MSNRNSIRKKENKKTNHIEAIITFAMLFIVIGIIIGLKIKTDKNKISANASETETINAGKETVSQIAICIGGSDKKVVEIANDFCQHLIDNEIHLTFIFSPVCEHDIYGGHYDTYKIMIEDTPVGKLDLIRKEFMNEYPDYIRYIYFDDNVGE